MDFTLNEEQKMLQSMVRDFATNKLAPVAGELDRKQEFARNNFKMMAELGLFGLTIPAGYGGSGGDEVYSYCCRGDCQGLYFLGRYS